MKIAIIPARGGSKRVEGKNLMPIQGKPLVAYTIIKAVESGVFDQVYVNSDDDEILSVAERYGAIPYRRKHMYATDEVSIIDVIKEQLNTLNLSDNVTVGILLATSPLRAVEDIIGALDLFIQSGAENPVVSVTSYETPIQLAQYVSDDGFLVPVFPVEYSRSTKSTGHKKVYKYNESIIINSSSNFYMQNNLIGKKPIPFVMPPERSLLIDYPYQMDIVRFFIENNGV